MAQAASSAWLGLPRSSAIGWSPLATKPYPSPFQNIRDSDLAYDVDSKNRRSIEKRMIINISGRKFEISQYLVDRYPQTLLGSSTDRERYFDKTLKEYFFDRDPEIFRYVLIFYRQGYTHFARNECSSAFEEEMTFFRIDLIGLNFCCYEVYEDYHQEALERMTDIHQELLPDLSRKFEGLCMKKIRFKIWEAFENPASSLVAQVLYYVSGFFIAASVFANVLETIPCSTSPETGVSINFGIKYETIFSCSDAACVILFTVEYIFRLFASPEPFRFFRSVMSVIDVVAILPFYVGLMMHNNKVGGIILILFCVL